jgi:anti-sigma B factor antagonist
MADIRVQRTHPEAGGVPDAKLGETAHKVGARCHLETARVASASYLVLIGELDLSCVDRFGTSLVKSIADSPEDLVIDLRSLTFIDSTGLSLLIKADKLAREEGARLHIVRSPAEIVRAVFEASGMGKILPLVDQPPRFRSS